MSLMPKGMAKQHAREPGHVSVRNKTVAMVEGHLNKQRSAYDHWIAELCRDAEESAMERDRLKAKLAALRDDHKRKVMTKIIGRLGNMNYFVAWNHWHTVTIKDAQKRAGERIRELKKQLKECKKKTEELEAEAQRRADEAAALAFGAATDSQKKLIWKILTRLSTAESQVVLGPLVQADLRREAPEAAHDQDFETYDAFVPQQGLRHVALRDAAVGADQEARAQGADAASRIVLQLGVGSAPSTPSPRRPRVDGVGSATSTRRHRHAIAAATPLTLHSAQDQLVKELEELERLAKKYKDDAEERQNQAASAAFARATGAQKDMMIKILSKLTGNMSMLSFKVWKRKSDEFTQPNLLKKS